MIVYDFIATAQPSVMGDLFLRLGDLPLSPLLMWGQGASYVRLV